MSTKLFASYLRQLAMLFLSCFISISCLAYRLPDLGSSNLTSLSSSKEQELTREFLKQILKSERILNDPVIVSYVQNLGQRLVRHSPTPSKKFHFFVVNNDSINAFAGPGGFIGINSGLILTMDTEGQLAAVLAHEIAHVTQHHLSRMIERANQLRIPSYAAVLAGILLGAVSPGLGAGVMATGMGASAQNMLNFSRENEQEADRIGIRTLYQSGYDPNDMPKLFEHFMEVERLYPLSAPEYLRTHPLSRNRIADTKNRAKQYPIRKYNIDQMNFTLIKARVRVAATSDVFRTTQYFENQLKKNPNNLSAGYGYSLALLKQRKTHQALVQNEKLLQQQPNNILFVMNKAAILLKLRKDKQSLALLEKTAQYNPDYYPLVVQYANNLVASEQNKQAVAYIHKQLYKYPRSIQLYSLLAKAQAHSGDRIEAYQTRAKMYALLGNVKQAKTQLQIALRSPNLTRDDRDRMQAQIRLMEGKL